MNMTQDLSTMNRPRCHLTAIIIHGYATLVYLSDHDQPKNSSTMIELTSHALTVLEKECKVELAQVRLNIQADNTVREMKNNPYLKWMSSLVSSGVRLQGSSGFRVYRFR